MSAVALEAQKAYFRAMAPVNFELGNANITDITYKYFRNPSQKFGKTLTAKNVANENMDKTIPMVLLLHGWKADGSSKWYRLLKDEYFKLGPYHIIYINWSEVARKTYEISSANTKVLGKFVGEFLIASEMPQENVHLIGHSLGAHIASFIGKSVFAISGKRLGRITALDPSGLKFGNPSMGSDSRLCDTDAEFVDVVHTDIQFYGYTAPTGQVDYYPNEGKHQPGCGLRDEEELCSHERAVLYFVESLSRKCKAEEATFKMVNNNVTVKVKDDGKEIIFGQHVDKSAKGVYYFETNMAEPFLKSSTT